jgi:hypothetical protein
MAVNRSSISVAKEFGKKPPISRGESSTSRFASSLTNLGFIIGLPKLFSLLLVLLWMARARPWPGQARPSVRRKNWIAAPLAARSVDQVRSQENIEDAEALLKLARNSRTTRKEDAYIVSVRSMKKTEDIETRQNIRGRLKR